MNWEWKKISQICVQFNLISTRMTFARGTQCNSCARVEIKFLWDFHLNFCVPLNSIFTFFSQDVRSHCKIVRCQINRLTQFMFFSKWLRFLRSNSSEIWQFMWAFLKYSLNNKFYFINNFIHRDHRYHFLSTISNHRVHIEFIWIK
jgi:hypothetical protein